MSKIDITTTHNAHGFYSCMNIATRRIVEFCKEHNKFPTVDFSPCFSLYKDSKEDNIYDILFKENLFVDFDKVKFLDFDDFGNWANYRKVIRNDFPSLGFFIDRYFRVSGLVNESEERLVDQYDIEVEKTAAIFFRGADKFTDGDQFVEDYDNLLIPAKEKIIHDKSIKDVIVQSDQSQFIEYARSEISKLGVRVIVFTEARTTEFNLSGRGIHHITPVGERISGIVLFTSIVQILSKCKVFCTTTSNTARWISYYRGKDPDSILQIFKHQVVESRSVRA
mgnify:CR=1 FL=1